MVACFPKEVYINLAVDMRTELSVIVFTLTNKHKNRLLMLIELAHEKGKVTDHNMLV